MGLINSMFQRTLLKQAERVAKWAAETYPVVKGKNEGLSDQQIHMKMLAGGDELSKMSESARHIMEECSQTIEGVCYLTLMVRGITKGMMNLQLVQLMTHVDRALYARGFGRQSKAMKERILSALDVPLEDWEKWDR